MLVLGSAKHKAIASREIQTDTPALRWYTGRFEPADEILRCCHPFHSWTMESDLDCDGNGAEGAKQESTGA